MPANNQCHISLIRGSAANVTPPSPLSHDIYQKAARALLSRRLDQNRSDVKNNPANSSALNKKKRGFPGKHYPIHYVNFPNFFPATSARAKSGCKSPTQLSTMRDHPPLLLLTDASRRTSRPAQDTRKHNNTASNR